MINLTFKELFPELNDSQIKMLNRELMKCLDVANDIEEARAYIKSFILSEGE